MLNAVIKAKTVPLETPFAKVAYIERVEYDLWTLRLTLLGDTQNVLVYLIFEQVKGFRVLDEGTLLEFWDSDTRVDGLVWEILVGGWLDLERTRWGFITVDSVREFLVLGGDECVSVIGFREPRVEVIKRW